MMHLPIHEIMPTLIKELCEQHEAILEAPPGAGKTTAVPIALMNQAWLADQKIIVLEPRRIAAKSAAIRMSETLNSPVGQQVGYRVRHETKVSKSTRIEVVTEGVLTRMLQQDPSLEGIGLIIFDEFHERSLTNDLNLALCLEAREIFRDDKPLKLLIMSATLNTQALAKLLNQATIIKSEGRSYPVDVIHASAVAKKNQQTFVAYRQLEDRTIKLILQIIEQHSGSVLVFLPGQREIQYIANALLNQYSSQLENISVAPLYGSLPFAKQQQAISPAGPDSRKIVLATNIAETSITIDGISVVIDSGLCKVALFDASTGITRLNTQNISQASAIQRAGRAGRTSKGTCYRLYTQEQYQAFSPFESPEIQQADLSNLVLNLLMWGNNDCQQLKWLNSPREGQLNRALALLETLGAIEKQKSAACNIQMPFDLTFLGHLMAQLPMSPRLAHLCIKAASFDVPHLGCHIAALLSEGDPLKSNQSDFLLRLHALEDNRNDSHSWKKVRQQSQQYYQLITTLKTKNEQTKPLTSLKKQPLLQQVAILIACTWPDHIAQKRSSESNEYKLANGRGATLSNHDHLHKEPYLAIAHCFGKKGVMFDTIQLACQLDVSLLQQYLPHLVEKRLSVFWDKTSERIRAQEQFCINTLIMKSQPTKNIDIFAKRELIYQLIQERGLQLFNWSKSALHLKNRVFFLHDVADNTDDIWPDFSDEHLLSSLDKWLTPYVNDDFIENFSQLSQLKKIDIANILNSLLPWPLPQQLDEQAPTHFLVPSGSTIAIDYAQNPPILAVKLQEMFGCTQTPVIAKSSKSKGFALQVHLLSPAGKPLQITQDIANFWQESYILVKKEMKGKYPRHPWPDDPLSFIPTKKTKRKLAMEKPSK